MKINHYSRFYCDQNLIKLVNLYEKNLRINYNKKIPNIKLNFLKRDLNFLIL